MHSLFVLALCGVALVSAVDVQDVNKLNVQLVPVPAPLDNEPTVLHATIVKAPAQNQPEQLTVQLVPAPAPSDRSSSAADNEPTVLHANIVKAPAQNQPEQLTVQLVPAPSAPTDARIYKAVIVPAPQQPTDAKPAIRARRAASPADSNSTDATTTDATTTDATTTASITTVAPTSESSVNGSTATSAAAISDATTTTVASASASSIATSAAAPNVTTVAPAFVLPIITFAPSNSSCSVLADCFHNDDCNGGTCVGAFVGRCNCNTCLNLWPCSNDAACGGLQGACNSTHSECDCLGAMAKHGFPTFLDALTGLCNVKACSASNATSACFGLPCSSGKCIC